MLAHATLHDRFREIGADSTYNLVVAVGHASSNWPELVISGAFSPGPDEGFHPGIFLVPETHRLFVGAGTRLLAYDLQAVRLLWEDVTYPGFWGWKRYRNVWLMEAELELAAWDISGKKLWSTFVEPPWDCNIEGTKLHLDVMGRKSSFYLVTGPRAQGRR
jgi:hypothetical protein